MRLLRALSPGLVLGRRLRHEFGPVALADEITRLVLRDFGHVGAVGAHVRNQAYITYITYITRITRITRIACMTDLTRIAQLHPFVQNLRVGHRLAGREGQAA